MFGDNNANETWSHLSLALPSHALRTDDNKNEKKMKKDLRALFVSKEEFIK
jgi:hypothetical protein